MFSRPMKRKAFALLVTGGLLLGSGCSFRGLASNIWIGFGRSIGSIPANVVNDLFIAPFIDAILNPDGAE